MAVNATEVLYLTSGLFKAAPSKAILTDLVKFNGTIDGLAASLGTSPYAVNAFPFSNAEKAKVLAENLLGSTVADKAAAITALEGILNANGGNVGIAAAAGIRAILTDAAFADAKAQLENRVKVAAHYVDSNKGNEISTSILDAVTNDAATVTTAIESLTGTTGGNEAGVPRVLTTGQDVFTGTSGNDNFRAVAGVQQGFQDQTTLNSSDNIDGATGDDTLIVNMTGTNYAGGARIKNIETLQIGTNLNAAVTFDYNVNMGDNEVSGVNTVKYDQITTGETLNVINITPSATGTTIPTLHWANENGSVAGTAGATYRQASIAGTADNQNIILENVTNGDLNIARGIETITITSSGTVAANTLTSADAADGTAVDLVSETLAGNGVNDDSTLTKVIVKGEKAFGTAAAVNTNDTAAETAYGLTNRAANGAADTGVAGNGQASSASNLVSVAATVTEIDATEANGGVAMRFTGRVDNAAVNVTFKGGKAADYIEFQRGNINATGGEGNDTFAFVNGNLSDFDFGSADSVTGGAGSDTIQLGLNGNGTVVARTTEFNNKTGIDVLDLRANQSTVTLADALVAGADAGTFTVRTDKIYQTSATSTANTAPSNVLAANNNANVALENNSTHTVVLTELDDNRAIEFIGGSGSDRIVVDNASANQFTKLDGGTNAAAGSNDSLTVVNTSVLDANDVANIKGFELLNLVENTLGNSAFNVTLSEAFVLANTVANGAALNIASVTGTYGQRLGAGDTVTLEVTDLLSAGAQKASLANRTINVQDLIAAGVTVTFQWKDTNGVTQTTTNAAPAALAARFELAVAPAATVLDDVTGATVAAGGAAAPAATNVAVAEGASVIGAAANENFQVTNTANFAAGTTVNGAGGTNSLQLMVATAANAVAIQSAAAGAGAISIANIDTLILADGGNTGPVTINDANVRLANITGGTGNDSVTVTAMASGGTINLGGGSDTLTINATLTGAQTLTGGDGVDTLVLGAAQNLTPKTISGFENLNITGVNGTVTLSIAQYNSFNGGITANANDVLSFSDGGTVTVNASNNTVQQYVFGAATTFSVLNASNTNTTVTGSAGVDVINYGAATGTTRTIAGDGADTITLNAANGAADVIVYTAATNGGDTITGFIAAGDAVEIDGALQTALDDIGAANAAFAWGTAAGGAGTATAVNITTTSEAINILGGENGGAAAVTAANLTNLTSVAALINQEITLTAAVGDDALVLIESATAGTFGVYVYTEAATAGVQATELTLLGVVTGDAVTTADLVMA